MLRNLLYLELSSWIQWYEIQIWHRKTYEKIYQGNTSQKIYQTNDTREWQEKIAEFCQSTEKGHV